MSQTAQNQDFQPIPTYSQTTQQNDSWVVVTMTKDNPDGSRSQTTAIEAKPR